MFYHDNHSLMSAHVLSCIYNYTTDLTVFGVSLDVAIQRSLLGIDGIELPTVFRLCIDYLEENGTDTI